MVTGRNPTMSLFVCVAGVEGDRGTESEVTVAGEERGAGEGLSLATKQVVVPSSRITISIWCFFLMC